ncbi:MULTISPECIES: acireductone synthase [unclassified Stenotrophomonas]|uniref:acireductone synthase n=1 Tax=unclassified Stenotrophomonas TaxID=196198 RepID=UPI0005AEEDF3|nr:MULTISPECIES: acireductone synthase [unclassified Stenotrophomonas]KIP85949.1 haloacid dehalogenase [Stenotrophomonas maltophilia]MBD8642932.1 acireductone synthase [Stenotrophomonas sp. CFBP 13724]MDY1034597.1 acireductone synthase [Stenotrophomonas sp. CFBP8980]
MQPRVILTDIEGTTSSISFVKNVLFPYARQALPGFIAAHGNEPQVRRWLDAVATEIGGACQDSVVAETLQGWIDQDRKHTALKALQGMIWESGYRNGDYKAHFYPEVAAVLKGWHAAGLPLYVYSSGSVPAQKQFFGFSEAGDLTALVSGWFDTEIGGKREADSYRRIVAAIGVPAAEIVFLSDVVEELDAAREAGLQTRLLDRLDDYPLPRSGEGTHGHDRVENFQQITL